MLKPVKLEVEGFQPFKDRQVFDLTGHSTLLTGKRIDSPVTSGTGKSSVVNAIAYALGKTSIPATELKNRDAKKMSVWLTLSDGTNTYEISRTPKLGLKINNNPVEGLSSAVEAAVKDLLKASPEVVEMLTYKAQRSIDDRFVRKTDAEKKDFLSKIIPEFVDLEKAADKVDGDFKRVEMSYNSIVAQIDSSKNLLATLTYDDAAIANAEASKNAAYAELQQALSSKVPPELTAEIQKLSFDYAQASDASNKIARIEMQSSTIQQQLAGLLNEINQLSENKCFTCQREWNTAQETIEHKKSQGAVLYAQKQELQGQLPELKLLFAEREQRLAKLTAKQAEAAKYSEGLPQKQQMYNAANSSYLAVKGQKDSYMQYQSRISNLELEKGKLEAEYHRLKHAATVFGKSGFASVIFSEILSEIEFKMNDLIPAFDNVSQFYVRFDTVSTAKNGNVKNNISMVITKGNEVINFKTLSGGQQCAIELCGDIAVSEVIKRRTGSPLGWIILDEAMDGFDTSLKAAAIEALKSKMSDSMIIIDHATEIKESFENVIEVKHDGNKSWV